MSEQADTTLFESFGGGADPALHTDPDDVANDRSLTSAQKRAILASWVSDARAVEDAPALRRLDNGALVEVDAVLRALARLDGAPAKPRLASRPAVSRSPDGRVIWLGRRHSDGDDDPPPAPAGAAAPFRLVYVSAYGAARPASRDMRVAK